MLDCVDGYDVLVCYCDLLLIVCGVNDCIMLLVISEEMYVLVLGFILVVVFVCGYLVLME